jgi:hypothetical protein
MSPLAIMTMLPLSYPMVRPIRLGAVSLSAP